MRITILQGAFLPVPARLGGAVEKIWHALGREFARRGHRVVHVSRLHGDLPARETDDAGVEHRRVRGFDTPRSLAVLKALDAAYTLRARRVLPAADVLVSNTFWLPLLAPRAAGEIYVNVNRFPRGQIRFYRRAARLQAVSGVVLEAMRAEAPALADRMVLIPNPLLSDVAVPDEAALDALDHVRAPRTLLFVGRLHPEKGVNLLLDAFARFGGTPAGAGWRLRVVGPWENALGGGGETFFRDLRARADALRLADRVDWVGFVSAPARLREELSHATLFVYPSLAERGEAAPVAPLEAMGNGCPLLVSDLDCFAGYLCPGETGWKFDHRGADPVAALAGTLGRLAADPPALARAGRAAWRRSQEFSLARVADLYLADFQALSLAP